jgi:coenzyme F420-reducing hydrogenase beta subunit
MQNHYMKCTLCSICAEYSKNYGTGVSILTQSLIKPCFPHAGQNYCYACPVLSKTGISLEILVKFFKILVNRQEYAFRNNRVVTCVMQ